MAWRLFFSSSPATAMVSSLLCCLLLSWLLMLLSVMYVAPLLATTSFDLDTKYGWFLVGELTVF